MDKKSLTYLYAKLKSFLTDKKNFNQTFDHVTTKDIQLFCIFTEIEY